MSAHTPGPWIVADSSEFEGFEFDIKAGRFYVAAIPDVPGQTEANARLIGAAPDMLAFLKTIIPGSIYEPEIEALIAKAEGREP